MNIFAACCTQKRRSAVRMSQLRRIIYEFFHFHMHFAKNIRKSEKNRYQCLNKCKTLNLSMIKCDLNIMTELISIKFILKSKKTKFSFEINSEFVCLRFSTVVDCFSNIRLMFFFRIDKMESLFFV